MNAIAVKSHTSGGRVTQSYRLYTLFRKKGHSASREQIANALKLKPSYVGSYLAEFKRVYGAKLAYNPNIEKYILKNKVIVPKEGLAGRKTPPKHHMKQRRARIESAQAVS